MKSCNKMDQSTLTIHTVPNSYSTKLKYNILELVECNWNSFERMGCCQAGDSESQQRPKVMSCHRPVVLGTSLSTVFNSNHLSIGRSIKRQINFTSNQIIFSIFETLNSIIWVGYVVLSCYSRLRFNEFVPVLIQSNVMLLCWNIDFSSESCRILLQGRRLIFMTEHRPASLV